MEEVYTIFRGVLFRKISIQVLKIFQFSKETSTVYVMLYERLCTFNVDPLISSSIDFILKIFRAGSEATYLVTFAEEILNGNLPFLCSVLNWVALPSDEVLWLSIRIYLSAQGFDSYCLRIEKKMFLLF